jgi:hypothetical protein
MMTMTTEGWAVALVDHPLPSARTCGGRYPATRNILGRKSPGTWSTDVKTANPEEVSRRPAADMCKDSQLEEDVTGMQNENVKTLNTLSIQPDEELVAWLRETLALAESGELHGIVFVTIVRGSSEHGIRGRVDARDAALATVDLFHMIGKRP